MGFEELPVVGSSKVRFILQRLYRGREHLDLQEAGPQLKYVASLRHYNLCGSHRRLKYSLHPSIQAEE
jgi:hypothetical protein